MATRIISVSTNHFLNSKGLRLEKFTRVETFGDNQQNGNNDVHWLKVLVNKHSRGVFAYQPQIVPANRNSGSGALAGVSPLKRLVGCAGAVARRCRGCFLVYG